MYYMQVALFVIGSTLLVVGYRRNRRNWLLAAAIVLFLSSAGPQFIQGFADGVAGAVTDGARR